MIMNSLSDLCFEAFIQDKRTSTDLIIDDLSSKEIIDRQETIVASSSLNTSKLFSNKNGKRGMQKEKSKNDARVETIKKQQLLLSSIQRVEEQTLINVLFPKVKTIFQLLKLIDKTVVKTGNQEHIRSLIFSTLHRVSPPFEIMKSFICVEKPLCTIPINDAVLFIETTPRALVFILKKAPHVVYLIQYGAGVRTFCFHDFFSDKKNERPLDLFWTSSGRYITLTDRKTPVFSFDLFSQREIIDHSRFSTQRYSFTNESVRFLIRLDIADFNPCLTESNKDDILDHRYRFRNTVLNKVFIVFRNDVLNQHLKFKKIMGWNK